jgi:putative phosphoesterase
LWTRKLPLEETRVDLKTPILLGVLGDTHMHPGNPRRNLDRVVDLFARAGVGQILHTGDAGDISVLRTLEEIAPVLAVRGNADPIELIEALPDQIRIAIGSRTVLLLHGHHGKTARVAARAAAKPEVDLVVFGHSHKPLIEQEGDTILFNPGSPTERRWNPHFGVGLIHVSEEAIDPELVLFDDPHHLDNVTY